MGGRVRLGNRILRRSAAIALAGMVLSACVAQREKEIAVSPAQVHDFIEDKPEPLHRHFLVMLTQGERNRVLNAMRLGLAAFEMGEDKLAADLFDQALFGIETVYADTDSAKTARSLWYKESVKDFKGEPYERAMAYYYRGLLYLREGDYENARASFKSGILQDAFAEEEQNRADFALLMFLEGWASRCIGDSQGAASAFAEMKKTRSGLAEPAPDDDTLILFDIGGAPRKLAVAKQKGEKPRYIQFQRAGAGAEDAAFALIPNSAKNLKNPYAPETVRVRAPMVEDIFFQANSRGGRPIDSILHGKAQFKEGANTAGNVMLAAGLAAATVVAENRNQGRGGRQKQNDDGAVAAAAAILIVGGLVAKGISEAVEPEPDTRYWDNLPNHVSALTAPIGTTGSHVAVEFQNVAYGLDPRPREVEIKRRGRCGLAWARSEPAVPWTPRAPGSVAAEIMSQPVVLPPKPSAEDILAAKAKAEDEAAKDKDSPFSSVLNLFKTENSGTPPANKE